VGLRIVLITSSFYPNSGGLETAVLSLASEFQSRGHEVTIVAARWPKKLPARESLQGLPVLRLPFRLPRMSRPWSLLTFFIRFTQCMYALLAGDAIRNADIVNLHYPTENALYARRIARRLGVPMVTSLHGNDLMQFATESRINRRTVSRVLQQSAAVTANSKAFLDHAEAVFGREIAGKGVVVMNGTAIRTLPPNAKPTNEQPYILAVGRLVKKKGFDVLLRAYALMRSQNTHWRLVVVGDGPERRKLEDLAHRLGIYQDLCFAGCVSHDDIWRYYRDADLFVLPSRVEPFGIVVLEAMAAGLAVLATNVGGVPEVVVDGETGILVNPESPEDLSEAAIELLGNRLMCEQMGKRGRNRVEREFTWQKSAGQLLSVYRDVLTRSAD